MQEKDKRFGRAGYGERKHSGRTVLNQMELELIFQIKILTNEGFSNQKAIKTLGSMKISTKRGGK